MLKISLHNNKFKERNSNLNSTNDFHEEYQYIHLLNDIIQHGEHHNGRNGDTLSIYGASLQFSLENNTLPILTTKKTAWKTCLKELLWFIRGDTSNKRLNDQNVHIWDGNSTKDFLEERGLPHYAEGDLGPLYGFQWRHWNAKYGNFNDDYSGSGIDQIKYVIDSLKDPQKRYSRRLIVSAWNTEQLNQMAVPPCNCIFQFSVHDTDKLKCSVFCRSQDVPLGQPFNIASYSFLTHLIAFHTGLTASELTLHCGNCHIYKEHLDTITEQLNRNPYPFPKLTFARKHTDINDYSFEDFIVSGYSSHPAIKMKMVA